MNFNERDILYLSNIEVDDLTHNQYWDDLLVSKLDLDNAVKILKIQKPFSLEDAAQLANYLNKETQKCLVTQKN